MAARNHEGVKCFSFPGFYAAIFPRGLFMVSLYALSEREITPKSVTYLEECSSVACRLP